jgi:hypothetical protein
MKTAAWHKGMDVTEFCVKRGLVGIGWGLDPASATREEYWRRGRATWGRKGWSAAANALLFRMNDGDFVWARNRQFTYYLGKIDGPWRPENGPEFVEYNLGNVRPCVWTRIGTEDRVPGAVINAFRPRSTIQQVTDPEALILSQFIFAQQQKQPFTPPEHARHVDTLHILSDKDLEDVVAVYIQVVERCVMFPSTCKKSTAGVECLFASVADGRRVGMQVKSGATSIDQDQFTDFDGLIYLFALSGNYLGHANPRCECLQPDAIRTFLLSNRELMPGRIQRWIDYVQSCS